MKSTAPVCVVLMVLSLTAGAAEESLRDRDLAQTGLDPTLVETRLGGGFRSNTNRESGADTSSWVATGAFAKERLAIAAEAPFYVRHNPGAGDTVSGIGDLLLRGQAGFMAEDVRVAGVLETSFNTSTKDLGAQANIITPEIAVSKDLGKIHTLTGQVRWSFDGGREDGVDHTSLGQIRGGVVSMWGDEGFTKFEGRVDRDFEHNENSLTAAAAIGRNFDRHHTGYLATTQPLTHVAREDRGWDLELSYLYTF